jgi:hypothetical protein
MFNMQPERHEHNGWSITLAPGRTCVGSAAQGRPPHRIEMVKGFSTTAVLQELRRRIDALEAEGEQAGDQSGVGPVGSESHG